MADTDGGQRRPLPLWVGLYGGLVEALLILGLYNELADPTRRGWFATGAVAAELWGVLLIASPEVRPIAERTGAVVAGSARAGGRRLKARARRVLGIRKTHNITLGTALEMDSALGLKVARGTVGPPAEASLEDKVTFLLGERKRLVGLIETLENQTREQIDELRSDIRGATAELREHTAVAVKAVAEAELQMRLLGVVFVVVGLVLSYVANIV